MADQFESTVMSEFLSPKATAPLNLSDLSAQEASDFLRVLEHILVIDKRRPRNVGRQSSELESISNSVNSPSLGPAGTRT